MSHASFDLFFFPYSTDQPSTCTLYMTERRKTAEPRNTNKAIETKTSRNYLGHTQSLYICHWFTSYQYYRYRPKRLRRSMKEYIAAPWVIHANKFSWTPSNRPPSTPYSSTTCHVLCLHETHQFNMLEAQRVASLPQHIHSVYSWKVCTACTTTVEYIVQL